MLMIPAPSHLRDNGYPTEFPKKMPTSDWHRDLMSLLIDMLREHFASEPRVYVAGDNLIFYEKGNKRKHVSPDVYFVRGVEKDMRRNYLLWEEKQAPQVVLELTSESTNKEDTGRKKELYRDVLRVKEYFLFDAEDGVLDPRLQGFRLWRGDYRPIQPVAGRLPSQHLGLHLEADGKMLRLWDPTTQAWLLTQKEKIAQLEAQIAKLTAQANGGR